MDWTSGEGGKKEKELGMEGQTRKLSPVRGKISYHLSHEFGVSRAEIARELGVCTSAVARAMRNVEVGRDKC
jgi:hypothetical protein